MELVSAAVYEPYAAKSVTLVQAGCDCNHDADMYLCQMYALQCYEVTWTVRVYCSLHSAMCVLRRVSSVSLESVDVVTTTSDATAHAVSRPWSLTQQCESH